MTFDFIYSKDLYEIREKVLKLDKELRNTCKEEVAVIEEAKSEHLIKRLEEADKHIFTLTTKLRNLIDNYAAFSSILESKNELGNQVSELKKKNSEITDKYDKEIEKLKNELRETEDTWSFVLADAQEEHRKKIVLLEDSCKEKLLREESLSQSLQEKLNEVNKTNASNFEMLKKQHHEELENLRIQLEVLQRSYPSSCGMNIYAQKFQQAKSVLESKLEEKDKRVQELTGRLKEAEGEIKHLKLLSVVRNAQKAPMSSYTGEIRQRSLNFDSSLMNPKDISRTTVENGENNRVTTSFVAVSGNGSKVQENKGPKKRKLYSKVTFACPEEILY